MRSAAGTGAQICLQSGSSSQIVEVLSVHQAVRDLAENGWGRLVAINPNGIEAYLSLPGREWQAAHDVAMSASTTFSGSTWLHNAIPSRATATKM